MKKFGKLLSTRLNRNYLSELNEKIDDMENGFVINKYEDFIENGHVHLLYTETKNLKNCTLIQL